jgi:hypothetical protein
MGAHGPASCTLVAVSAAAPGTLSLDEDVQQVETLGATQYVDTAMLGYLLRIFAVGELDGTSFSREVVACVETRSRLAVLTGPRSQLRWQ